jgi:site-specific DNA-methyltransferase (adenine-specific)
VIRLIGIKQNSAVNGETTKFLSDKLKGKRVFMRYDDVKYDCDNRLMAYLYRENKTFVNAHLLKEKLVDVDNSFDFRYKNKFQTL